MDDEKFDMADGADILYCYWHCCIIGGFIMIECYRYVDDYETVNERTRYEKRVKSGSHIERVKVNMPLGCVDKNGRINANGQRYLDTNGLMRIAIMPEILD